MEKLEERLDGEIGGRLRTSEDGVGKLRMAVKKLTKSFEDSGANSKAAGEAEVQGVRVEVETKIKDLKAGLTDMVEKEVEKVGVEVERVRTEMGEEVSSHARAAVCSRHGTQQRLTCNSH